MNVTALIIIILSIVFFVFLYIVSTRISKSPDVEYITQKEWDEGEKENQLEKQLIDAVSLAITGAYTIAKCSRCNDRSFIILQFNSDYTGMEIECETCSKKTWLTADIAGGEKIEKAWDTYIDKRPWESEYVSLPLLHVSSRSERPSTGRASIPKKVKQEVWQRDGGKCAECGSQEYLEYDHIIPVSKGGSNTARNIQL